MRRLLVIAAFTVVVVSGCASHRLRSGADPAEPAVPAEFQAACGRPGALVEVSSVPVTIARAACDLTGVEVRYGLASVTVPEHGRAERRVQTFAATDRPTHITVTVDDLTHDVTITD